MSRPVLSPTARLAFALTAIASAAAAQPPARYNVPPPPGYGRAEMGEDSTEAARAADARYAYEAERWAAENCIEQRANNAAAGTVIGGLLGALAGSGLAGHGEHAAGAVVGGVAGALAGGAIGGSATNPNCPPGYVLRPAAPPFDPGPIYRDVVYVQPAWYDPWIWYGGHWIYRPYPYHRFWFKHHRLYH